MKTASVAHVSHYQTLADTHYAVRAAALRSARGALSHHGAQLGRELTKLRKERNRPLPKTGKR